MWFFLQVIGGKLSPILSNLVPGHQEVRLAFSNFVENSLFALVFLRGPLGRSVHSRKPKNHIEILNFEQTTVRSLVHVKIWPFLLIFRISLHILEARFLRFRITTFRSCGITFHSQRARSYHSLLKIQYFNMIFRLSGMYW